MKEREKYMLCCSCGYAFKDKNIFKKAYQNTAICLCRKCSKELVKDIESWSDTKRNEIAEYKTEAIKEFIDELKNRVVNKYEYTDIRVFNEIDNLVKEITEVSE